MDAVALAFVAWWGIGMSITVDARYGLGIGGLMFFAYLAGRGAGAHR